MAGVSKRYDIKATSEYSRLQDYTSYQPTEVGTFSISEDGDFINCNKAKIPTLKTYKLPLNLNEGYSPKAEDVSRETSFPQWEKGLKWIYVSLDGKKSISDVDVITQRGVLKDIGYTNHNRYKNPWKFEACKYKGKLYIRKFEQEEKWDARRMQNSYWGKKFEEFVMEQQAGTKATYNMLKGKIGNRNFLLSAEVDAVTPDGKHMEIKTCFANKLNEKIPLAWLQSLLGKVDFLYYGLKDKQGMVYSKPTEISMAQVPGRYVKTYEANAMVGFIGDIIDWVHTTIPDGDETWILEYPGGRGRQIVTLESQGKKFMPSWYLQFIDGSKEDDLVRQVEALSLEHPV